MKTCGFYGLYLHLVAKQEADIIPSRYKLSTPDCQRLQRIDN